MVKKNCTWISNTRKELCTLGLADLYHSTIKESVILDIIYDRMCDVFKQKVVNDIIMHQNVYCINMLLIIFVYKFI